MSEFEAHVVWADGLGDSSRDCMICRSSTCVNPVHAERYTIKIDKLAKQWDLENPVI
jgi:hypothetical protein